MRHFILLAEEGDYIGEKKLIQQHLHGEWSGKQWRTPDGVLWDLIITGVGAVNVIQILHQLPKDSIVLNIGYAGSANYEVGSVKQVSEVRLNHPNCKYPEPVLMLDTLPETYIQADPTICYSGADFVLQSDYQDCVFDMELAYIAAFGFDKVYALKIVSDNLSLHDYRQHAAGVE